MACKHFIPGAALLALVTAAHAEDGCAGGAKSAWKTPEDARRAAIGANYTRIVKVIVENGCYEVVTLDADGRIVGVQFDPVTLKLHKVEGPR